MSDEEDQVENGEGEEDEVPEDEPEPEPEPVKAASPASHLTSPPPAGREHGIKEMKREPPPKTIAQQARTKYFGAGKPSKIHDKKKLMTSEGIIPVQAGTNKYASQRGMTGFGVPRDIVDKIKSPNLAVLEDPEKIKLLKESNWLQSGTNKFASQKGQTGFGVPRDVNYKTKGTGGASEVPEDKARATDGIVPLQSGTNKLASQAGMTGIGMPRIVDVRHTEDQNRDSQGFIHLQMGTNKYANQAGMTGFGMPRHNISKYTDEVRGQQPHDESTVSRQTSGWKEGANQGGMTGFGAFRNTSVKDLQHQDQRSQGMIPYQMGVNFLDSQAGKTGFGQPRQVYTGFTDDSREELPPDMARRPEVPFWSGQEVDFANQVGMTCFGMPRDVRGEYVRRLW
jgi:hypothetical protein